MDMVGRRDRRTCCAVVDGDDALEDELPAGGVATPVSGNRDWG